MNGGEASNSVSNNMTGRSMEKTTTTTTANMEYETMDTSESVVVHHEKGCDQNGNGTTTLREHDYIGLSEVSSSSSTEANNHKHTVERERERACAGEELNLNLSATELRLGPPAALKSCKGDEQHQKESGYHQIHHDQVMEKESNCAGGNITMEVSAPHQDAGSPVEKRSSYGAAQQVEQSSNVSGEMKRGEACTKGGLTTSSPALQRSESQSLIHGLQRSPILQEFRMMKAAAEAQQMQTGAGADQNRPMQRGYLGGTHVPCNGSSRGASYPMKNNGVKRGFSEAVGGTTHVSGLSGGAREGQCDVNNHGDNMGGSGNEVFDSNKVKMSHQGKMWSTPASAVAPGLNFNNSHKASSSWLDKSKSSVGPFANMQFGNVGGVQRPLMNNRPGESSQDACSPMKSCGEASKRNMSEAMGPSPKEPVSAPVPRQQTVGWPPVKSFARNQNPVIPSPPPASPATVSASAQGKASSSAPSPVSLYVKIYMDGVPIGRKVDLKTNNSYDKLYWVIEEMFQQFVNGQYCGSRSGNMDVASSRKRDFLRGTDYVLIYEDHEGDFMLVGDVPWHMFINTVKRLRIMKGSEAVNLAPTGGDSLKSQAPQAAVG